MDPLRGVFWTTGSPIISGSISIHENVWLGLMYNVKRIGVKGYEP
jgi:hypothetical protein